MSRTLSRRFLRLLAELQRTEEPPAPPPGGLVPTRRAVLAGLGAAACLPKRPATTAPRVLILGAGLAGLTALHRLAQRGIRAEVLEARDRVGGRVHTARDPWPALPGVTVELGGEWVNSADRELRSLCRELDLPLRDSWEEFDLDDHVWLAGRRVPYRSLAEDLRELVRLCDRALAGLEGHGDAISHANPSGAEALDRTTAAEWFAGLEIGEDARRFAELVTQADYGLDLEEQSALNPISFFTSAGEDLYDERFLIGGGNSQIPELLAERHPGRVRLGAAVEALTRRADGSWSVALAGGEERLADAVICALPFIVLRRIDLRAELPPVQRACIDTLGHGTNAKLMLPFSRRFWRDAGDSGSTVNDRFQEGWDGAMMQGLDRAPFVSFRGGAAGVAVGAGTAEERGAELLADLEAFWPGCAAHRAGDAARAHWPSDPWVGGSYSCYRPGQWTGIGGAEAEPAGTLFFAGEHTSSVFQGYMNGAAESGARAAAEVADWARGLARRPASPRACRRRPRGGFPSTPRP